MKTPQFLKVRIIQIFKDNMTHYDYENKIGKHFSLSHLQLRNFGLKAKRTIGLNVFMTSFTHTVDTEKN
jgi:hypothetical protein